MPGAYWNMNDFPAGTYVNTKSSKNWDAVGKFIKVKKQDGQWIVTADIMAGLNAGFGLWDINRLKHVALVEIMKRDEELTQRYNELVNRR